MIVLDTSAGLLTKVAGSGVAPVVGLMGWSWGQGESDHLDLSNHQLSKRCRVGSEGLMG